MGDKLRQLAGIFRQAAGKALVPALLTCLVVVPLVGSAMEIDWSDFQILLVVCLAMYLQWIISMLVLSFQQQGFHIERTDAEIVGNAFGGVGKKSRMFCRALADFCNNAVLDGLDGFLAVLDMRGLTDKERQLCYFYIGRCYQLTGCSANAVQNYQRARELGMDNPYLLLFQARSMTDSGAYEDAKLVYDQLLLLQRPEFSCIRTDLGMLYLRQHDGASAMHWFEDSISKGENVAFAYGGCALACLLLHQPEQSQKFYEQAVTNRMADLEGFREYYAELRDAVEHPLAG
ncbi:MAG: hypothetical protein SO088_07085 [Ruminococcus callidus]|nr:hypothetical protein [Ruminococcus callidus]